MSADDLVVRLQATLDETASKAPTLHEDCCGHGRVEFGSDECWCGVPAAILRLVQAHRDLIAKREETISYRDHVIQQRAHGAIVMALDGAAEAWDEALKIVARGYGIEDQTAEEIK